MIIAVVITAAAIRGPIAAIRYPQYAVDGSNSATDTGANSCTNRTAYGAGDPVAFVRPLLRATHDALRVPDLR
jgi:hypothetical protein